MWDMSFLKRYWLYASVVGVLLCISLGAFLVWRASETVEPKTVYALPKPNPECAEILKRALQPPKRPYQTTASGGEEATTEDITADSLESDSVEPSKQEDVFPITDDFPDYLKCPEKWIGVYLSTIFEGNSGEYAEVEQQIHNVARKIIASHNPNRPLAEVWPRFIETEKQLHAQSEDVGRFPVNIGGNRIDWIYEQMRNFPEIFKLISEEGLDERWGNVYEVEMGYLSPDWNLFTLPDGREFRVRDGYRYQIHIGDDSAGGMADVCFSDLETAQLIVIENLEQVSDADLKRLGGWNYNFNPCTGRGITQ